MKKHVSPLVLLAAVGASIGVGSSAMAQKPSLIADVNANPPSLTGSSNPLRFFKSADKSFFFANDPINGFELWRTDEASPNGAFDTVFVRDINPGVGGSVINVNTGGTPARVVQYQPVTSLGGGRVVFYAFNPATGWEPWVSDGSDSGTFKLAEIFPGVGSSVTGGIFLRLGNFNDLPMVTINGVAYFYANAGPTPTGGIPAGPQIFKSDGTVAGTMPAGGTNLSNGIPTAANTYSFTGPRDLTVFNGKVFFGAGNATDGVEPYIYDPATDTTTRIADLNPAGNGYTGNIPPVVVGNSLYFAGNDGTTATGLEMYRWDGNLNNPPVKATNIFAAGQGLRVQFPFTALPNGKILMIANNGGANTELWAHDPALPLPNATQIDIQPGANGSFPRAPVVDTANGVAYFVAQGVSGTTQTGWELYRTDGTTATLVRDFNPGAGPGIATYGPDGANTNVPAEPFIKNGFLYFTATPTGATVGTPPNAAQGLGAGGNSELYRLPLNDPAAPYELVADFNTAGSGTPLFFAEQSANAVLCSAFTGTNGREPVVIDFTSPLPTMRRIRDINVTLSNSDPAEFVTATVGSDMPVFFRATTTANGLELMRSDSATPTTTAQVADLNAGGASTLPAYLQVAGSNLIYGGFNTSTTGVDPNIVQTGDGFELRSVSTAIGTTTSSTVVDLFAADAVQFPNNRHGSAVARSQGAPAIGVGNTVFIGGTSVVELNGRYIFMGERNENADLTLPPTTLGRELYASDGTAAGTVLIKDINLGSGSSLGWENPAATPVGSVFALPTFLRVGNVVYFSAADGGTATESDPAVAGGGGELWVTDGTEAGTVLAADIALGSSGSAPRNFAALSNANLGAGSIIFYADDGNFGAELWAYDPTRPEGSRAFLVKDINGTAFTVGSFVNFPFQVINGVAYFAANDGVNGVELWRTDGTEAGTFMVADLNPGATGSSPGPFSAVGSTLIFDCDNGQGLGFEPHAFDTTQPVGPTNPRLIQDLNPGSADGAIGAYVNFNNRVYFVGNNGQIGVELFKTDGTTVEPVADINVGGSGSNPANLTVSPDGSRLYFSANNGTLGAEPYVIVPQCSIADIVGIGGIGTLPDGIITGDDFNAYTAAFAANDLLADVAGIGGPPALPDGLITGDDFNAFISAFSLGCP